MKYAGHARGRQAGTLKGLQDVSAADAHKIVDVFGKATVEGAVPPVTGQQLNTERAQLGEKSAKGIADEKVSRGKPGELAKHADRLAAATAGPFPALGPDSVVLDSNVFNAIQELMSGTSWSALAPHKKLGINQLRKTAKPPLAPLQADPPARDVASIIGNGHDLRAAGGASWAPSTRASRARCTVWPWSATRRAHTPMPCTCSTGRWRFARSCSARRIPIERARSTALQWPIGRRACRTRQCRCSTRRSRSASWSWEPTTPTSRVPWSAWPSCIARSASTPRPGRSPSARCSSSSTRSAPSTPTSHARWVPWLRSTLATRTRKSRARSPIWGGGTPPRGALPTPRNSASDRHAIAAIETDGRRARDLYTIDLAHPEARRLAWQTTGAVAGYEPSTHLLAINDEDEIQFARVDPRTGSIGEPVRYPVVGPGYTHPVYLLDPARSRGNVALVIDADYTGHTVTVVEIRAVTGEVKVARSHDITTGGRDPTMDILRDHGLRFDGTPSSRRSPDGKWTARVDRGRITLRGADGEVKWVVDAHGATDVAWRPGGELAALGKGIAAIDVETGALGARQCGWEFGLGEEPELERDFGVSVCDAP